MNPEDTPWNDIDTLPTRFCQAEVQFEMNGPARLAVWVAPDAANKLDAGIWWRQGKECRPLAWRPMARYEGMTAA